jgi:predicted lipoprotein with Yx(FWY)xxD motif
MNVRLRTATLSLASAALLAVSGWGASAAFGATGHAAKKHLAVFSAQRVPGVKGLVLVEGNGLVVYTFTGDRRGHAGTCKGQCAAIWPPVHGTPVLAHGMKIVGKFGMIAGQVTFNGWPLYGFTGERPRTNHAIKEFPVVGVKLSPGSKPVPGPSPSPQPPPPTPMPTPSYPW